MENLEIYPECRVANKGAWSSIGCLDCAKCACSMRVEGSSLKGASGAVAAVSEAKLERQLGWY